MLTETYFNNLINSQDALDPETVYRKDFGPFNNLVKQNGGYAYTFTHPFYYLEWDLDQTGDSTVLDKVSYPDVRNLESIHRVGQGFTNALRRGYPIILFEEYTSFIPNEDGSTKLDYRLNYFGIDLNSALPNLLILPTHKNEGNLRLGSEKSRRERSVARNVLQHILITCGISNIILGGIHTEKCVNETKSLLISTGVPERIMLSNFSYKKNRHEYRNNGTWFNPMYYGD